MLASSSAQQHLASSGSEPKLTYSIGDIAPVAFVAVFVFVLTVFLHSRVPEQLSEERFYDAHFNADVPRAYGGMTSRWTRYGGNTKHPLVGYLVLPSYAMQAVGVPRWESLGLALGTNNALLSTLVYLLARKLTGSRVSATLLVLLMISCAASIFWLPVPETYAFGATTVVLPLTVFLFRKPESAYGFQVATHVFSLAVTLTNWTSSLATTWSLRGVRNTVLVSAHALGMLYILTILQPLLVPESNFINAKEVLNQADRYGNDLGAAATIRHFFLTANSPPKLLCSIVPPNKFKPLDWPYFDFYPHSNEIKAVVEPPSRAVQLCQNTTWACLLAAGLIYYLLKARDSRPFLAIYLSILAHLVISLKYGSSVFLYTMHWTPLLVLSISGLLTTKLRALVQCVIVLLIAMNLWINVSMFLEEMRVLQITINEILENAGGK